MAFRNHSPVSVYDKRVLHLDTSLIFKQNSAEHYHSIDDGNDYFDFPCLPRPPSFSQESEQSLSLDIQRSDTDSAIFCDEARDAPYNDAGRTEPPSVIEVHDERQHHDRSEELALLTQLRQELIEEESCLQLTFHGNVSVCHDHFPDFGKALRKARKLKSKSDKSNKTKNERRKGRLLNRMHTTSCQ